MPHTAAADLHFCELGDTAETCGMSEVSYHLRKAKLGWMIAYGSRETKQTCMTRLPTVRVHCKDGVEADRPRGGRWFSAFTLICTACDVFVILSAFFGSFSSSVEMDGVRVVEEVWV